MIDWSTFSKKQRDTFELINQLQDELTECVDPTTFTLNERAQELNTQIDEIRKTCEHVWDVQTNKCVICGGVWH